MIKKIVEDTGLSEEIIREDALATAKINGWQIEEPDTMSLVTHFQR